MTNTNTFDRLVTNLSPGERKQILSRIHAKVSADTLSLEADIDRAFAPVGGDFENRFNTESILVRIWLFLKALFLNNALDNVYKAYLLSRIAKRITKKYSGLLDYSRGVFLPDMYNKSMGLKEAADFFKTALRQIDNDPGNFYVFLGTFFIPLLSERFKSEIDPYNFSLGSFNTSELHITQIRKLEKIMQSIDPSQRSQLYSAIQSANWLMQFCNLPFRQFLSQFSGQGRMCRFSSVSKDINEFAKVLCNGKRIPPDVLEVLYLFNNQEIADPEASENAQEQTQNAEEFIQEATKRIKEIRAFLNSVPMQPIGALVYHSADWTPPQPDNAEDWFVRFKAKWRTIFDRKWAAWLAEQKKEAVRRQLENLFGLDATPLLPNRPWMAYWKDTPFKYDYALGFLAYFFKNIFPGYAQILKLVLLEGKFFQNEQRMAFTDAVDTLFQQEKNLDTLMALLTEDGDYGAIFAGRGAGAPLGNNKLNMVLQKIEAEAQGILGQFLNGCGSLASVLEGITEKSGDKPGSSTFGLSFPTEKSQADFKHQLDEVKEKLRQIPVLLKQIVDMVDSEQESRELSDSA